MQDLNSPRVQCPLGPLSIYYATTWVGPRVTSSFPDDMVNYFVVR